MHGAFTWEMRNAAQRSASFFMGLMLVLESLGLSVTRDLMAANTAGL